MYYLYDIYNNMKKIKSYARTIGKSLSSSSKVLLRDVLPEYNIPIDELAKLENLNIEIGFGDGEHLYNLAINNPEDNFLGVEVYLNGVCNLLKSCIVKKPLNLWIYPNDADLLLEHVPDEFVKAVYVLFPDPWPKLKHNKRRFLNLERINLIVRKLRPQGVFTFVTDVEEYFEQVNSLLLTNPLLKLTQVAENFEFLTKYHKKALDQGKKIFKVVALRVKT